MPKSEPLLAGQPRDSSTVAANSTSHKIAQVDLSFFSFLPPNLRYCLSNLLATVTPCQPASDTRWNRAPLSNPRSRNFTQILLVLINQKRMCPPAQTLPLLLLLLFCLSVVSAASHRPFSVRKWSDEPVWGQSCQHTQTHTRTEYLQPGRVGPTPVSGLQHGLPDYRESDFSPPINF